MTQAGLSSKVEQKGQKKNEKKKLNCSSEAKRTFSVVMTTGLNQLGLYPLQSIPLRLLCRFQCGPPKQEANRKGRNGERNDFFFPCFCLFLFYLYRG